MLLAESSPWPTLTLVVSLEAIFLSTFVMIGQNRASAFQQSEADHDFVEQVVLVGVPDGGSERDPGPVRAPHRCARAGRSSVTRSASPPCTGSRYSCGGPSPPRRNAIRFAVRGERRGGVGGAAGQLDGLGPAVDGSVLLVDPRGSDGYGLDFFTGAAGHWGTADERDLLDPVDQLVAEGVADPARLALTGYNYGGYPTCWLTGRTDRFAAAIAGGVVADLTSMVGTSEAGHALGEMEWPDPYTEADQLAEISPITRVAQVRTPTLVLPGQADERCPVGQAEQWFAALRTRGVPTELVGYPGSSQLFILTGRPSHRVDYSRRLVRWVQQHVRASTVPTAGSEVR